MTTLLWSLTACGARTGLLEASAVDSDGGPEHGGEPAVDPTWVASFGGDSNDYAYGLTETAGGDLVVVGGTSSFSQPYSGLILRLRPDGTPAWVKGIGRTGYSVPVYSALESTDGGLVIAGSIQKLASPKTRLFLAKLTGAGAMVWHKTSNEVQRAAKVVSTPDGGFAVLGRMDLTVWDQRVWLGRFSRAGELLWQRTLASTDGLDARDLVVTGDGGYVVAGEVGGFHSDAWVARLDSKGSLVWQRRIGGDQPDSASALIQNAAGGVVVVGETQSFGEGKVDAWILWLNRSGVVERQRTVGGRYYERATSVVEAKGGDLLVTGMTNDCGGHAPSTGNDLWFVRLASVGTVVEQRCLKAAERDDWYAGIGTRSGGVAVAGVTESFGEGTNELIVGRMDAHGQTGAPCTYWIHGGTATSQSSAAVAGEGAVTVQTGAAILQNEKAILAELTPVRRGICPQ